jgi:superfamily II DNA or RNA helicase
VKSLYPRQQDAADFFLSKLLSRINTLDGSHTGCGKTVVACYLAKMLGFPVAVICPKAVIPSWERELKEFGIDPIFVLNYEKIRTGNTQYMTRKGKKIFKWLIPRDTFVLVDEIHKAKGPFTLNAQLLISLVLQKYRVHGMSATASETPAEMRALGFCLGLHSLNKDVFPLQNWFKWMRKKGCYKDQWNNWKLLRSNALKELHSEMYGECAYKLSVKDFPDSFRDNMIFVEPIEFKDSKKIMNAYEELGITPDIITDYIEKGTVSDSEHLIVNLGRARQLAESFKVAEMVETANDLIHEGNSVVLFVNYKATVDSLCSLLKCGRIEGGQSAEERQTVIDDFQSDETHCIVANIAAGGTGISLHDTHGNRPRISLISPTFDAKSYLQTLGRIHRNGAKSDSIQKILVAAGTVEESVMASVQRKAKNIQELHGE